MTPCPVCGKPVDTLRARFVSVRDGKVIAFDSAECKAQAETQLTGALKSLFAVAENYPELKASEQFTGLQSSLNSIEDNIQNARRYYNAVVRDFNTRVQSFPTNIIAGMFGFHTRQFFEMETPADRENVAVKF